MEVFLLVMLVAFLFYIKSTLESKFDRIEDKMDEQFRELNRKIDLYYGIITKLKNNPSNKFALITIF